MTIPHPVWQWNFKVRSTNSAEAGSCIQSGCTELVGWKVAAYIKLVERSVDWRVSNMEEYTLWNGDDVEDFIDIGRDVRSDASDIQ
jgi:hypothetical protein